MYPTSAFSGIVAAVSVVSGGLDGLFADTVSAWPILGPYTPSPTLQLSDLVLGTGTVGELMSFETPDGTTVYTDPVTGNPLWYWEPPAGGWTWEYDGVTPAPGFAIYGFAVADDSGAGTNLYGVTLPLATPLVIAGHALIILDEVVFQMLPSAFVPR